MKKIKAFVAAHKFISAVVVIILLAGAYYWYSHATTSASVTKYVIEEASQGTVVASVSGSGQVQPGTTVDVKPQTSENVTRVYVKVGQHVAAGQLLVQLDTTNEAKSVAQAQLSLQSAKISLAKLQEVSTSTLQQDEDAVTQAEQTLATASTSLATDYQTGFDSLAASFVNFQNVMLGLQDFVTGNDLNRNQSNPDAYVNLLPSYLQEGALPYRNDVQSTYQAAVTAYQQNLVDYRAVNRNAPPATLNALFTETAHTAGAISDAVKASKALLNNVVNNYPNSSSTKPLPSITTTFQTNLGSYTDTINSAATGVAGTQNTITSDGNALVNAKLSLKEKQTTLSTLQAGPDTLDVQSSQLSIQQQELSLQTAEQQLADDSIRAPIAGTISAVNATVGAAASDPVVSIVGDGEVGDITLNETDAADVKVGDQATLTFDALPDLSLAGQVVEMDAVGTVSQGVVSYNVKVGFDDTASSTATVKPGMSVTADIVTKVAQDVIAVPNSAIKTQGGSKYVLEPATPVSANELSSSTSGGIVLPAAPKMVPVTTGLSNNTETEITSGIQVGDEIIIQSIQSTVAAASTGSSNTSALRALGGGGGAVFGGGGGAPSGGTTRSTGGSTGR